MEIMYLWVEDFKNIKNQEFNFSSEIRFHFDKEKNELITLEDNRNKIDMKKFFNKTESNVTISNITAVIGKNGTGKTNLFRVINEIISNEIKNKFLLIYKTDDIFFQTNQENLILINTSITAKKINFDDSRLNYFSTYDYLLNDISINSDYGLNLSVETRTKDISSFVEKKYTTKTIWKYLKKLNLHYILKYLSEIHNHRNLFNIHNLSIEINSDYLQRLISKSKDIKNYLAFNSPFILKTNKEKFLFNLKKYMLLDCFFNTDYDKAKINIEKNIDNYLWLLKQKDDMFIIENLNKIKFVKINNEKPYGNVETYYKSILVVYEILKTLDDENYVSETKLLLNIKENINIINEINHMYLDDLLLFDLYPIISTGEYSQLYLYSSIFYLITQVKHKNHNNKFKNMILYLDEIEITFHPELQREMIKNLINFFKSLDFDLNVQLIISTHSPIIASDLPAKNIIYLDKDENGNCLVKNPDTKTFGANIYQLFKDGFFMNDFIGEFAKEKINYVIEKLNSKDDKKLSEKEQNEIKFIINSIGEPVLRNKLNEMFYNKFDKETKLKSIDDEIKRLQKQRELLEKE